MKKITLLLFTFILAISCLHANPKHEFRATWLATVSGIDWPKTKVSGNSAAEINTKREQQKQELIDILDKMKAGNMNSVCMQVRSLCDAM